jgi:hypothetical protein
MAVIHTCSYLAKQVQGIIVAVAICYCCDKIWYV